MKRIVAWLLLCLLIACQPTPDTEPVVNKGDGTVEERLSATPKPAAPTETVDASDAPGAASAEPTDAPLERQTFPEHWTEAEEQLGEHLTISVDAEVLQREDGLYPVYRTRSETIAPERATALAATLLPNPKDVFIQEQTKEDYKRELQSYLDRIAELEAWVDAGRPPWPDHDTYVPTQEEIDAETARLQQAILNAPDQLTHIPVSDYSDLRLNRTGAYTLEDGGIASITYHKTYFAVSKGCQQLGQLYFQYDYEEDRQFDEPAAAIWKDVTADRAAAEETLNAELERLGFTGFAIERAYPANLLDTKGGKLVYVTGGWAFRLIRDYGGYPSVSVPYQPSEFLNYGAGSDTVVSEPISEEQIDVLINGDGLQFFSYASPKSIVERTSESVELLPFDTVKERTVSALKTCFPSEWTGDRDYRLEIYRMLLTTYTLHIRNSSEYYEMPCWIVFFDGNTYTENREQLRNRERIEHDVLILNAVDGSVIHSEWGY